MLSMSVLHVQLGNSSQTDPAHPSGLVAVVPEPESPCSTMREPVIENVAQ